MEKLTTEEKRLFDLYMSMSIEDLKLLTNQTENDVKEQKYKFLKSMFLNDMQNLLEQIENEDYNVILTENSDIDAYNIENHFIHFDYGKYHNEEDLTNILGIVLELKELRNEISDVEK